MENQSEVWKPIKGYEDKYHVSNMGKIKSLSRLIALKKNSYRKTKEKIISLSVRTKNTYYAFTLQGKTISVHRLVAEAFIDNPLSKPCVNHINGIKTDNRVENLEWVTYSENNKHAFAVLGRSNKNIKFNHNPPKGENCNFHKFKDCEIQDMKRMILEKNKPSEIMKVYKVSKGYLSMLKNKKRRHNG